MCSVPLTGRWCGKAGLGGGIVEVLKAGFGGRMDGRVCSRCQLEALGNMGWVDEGKARGPGNRGRGRAYRVQEG